MVSKDNEDIEKDSSLEEFLVEAEEIVEALNSELMRLDVLGTSEPDPALLNSIFRSAHTLKGLSGIFGFDLMVEVSHNLENLLDAMRLGKAELTPEVLDLLLESMSVVQVLLDAKSHGEDVPLDISDLLLRLDKALESKSVQEGSLGSAALRVDASIANVLTEYEEHRLNACLEKDMNLFMVRASFLIASFDQGLEELSSILKEQGEIITTLPSPGSTPGENIDFDLLLATESSKDFLAGVIDDNTVTISSALKDDDDAESSVESAPLASATTEDEGKNKTLTPPPAVDTTETFKSVTQTVRVDITQLDYLMNIVGELSIINASFEALVDSLKVKSSSIECFDDLAFMSTALNKKLAEIQQGMLETRMVPLSIVFDKLARSVRKTSRDMGKDIHFQVEGGETRLDKMIVEELGGPLMHIVRNSLDHGVEFPEERVKNGKAAKGVVSARAYQRGNHVIVEIEDDGRGIDPEKILKKAIEKGLAHEGDRPSREEILAFMFLPGFSTSEEVSEISGRGVGMDVVKQNIADLSGMVDIESEKGKGTKMMLVLPMTLAIIKALIVETCGQRYAIPLNSIVENFMLEETEIETIEGKEYVHLRDSNIPIVRLNDFLGVEGELDTVNYVIVVGMAEKKLGVVVEALHGQQDIVIKSIGKRFKDLKIISGATDYRQETILVLDVGGIIEECMGSSGAFNKAVHA